ncbi:hypothetical protein ACF068_18950 [Streptomyces sp. NPDC016309]|uniref:hypothetical protein n=1 Tax=Streptomyces sp. NPDC016309 TaxID=3364965 RepID=UPI0036FC0F76
MLVRTGFAVVAGAAAALALAGCDGARAGGTPAATAPGATAPGTTAPGATASGATASVSAAPGTTAPGTTGASTPGAGEAPAPAPSPASPSPAGAGEADGSWVGLTAGKPVSVTIKKGYALVLADAQVCQGTARPAPATGAPATPGTSGTVTLTLTCGTGYTARTEGSARTDAGKVVVTWAGGVKDTLAKADPPGTP